MNYITFKSVASPIMCKRCGIVMASITRKPVNSRSRKVCTYGDVNDFLKGRKCKKCGKRIEPVERADGAYARMTDV